MVVSFVKILTALPDVLLVVTTSGALAGGCG
jgi:hypothetical protein